MNRRTCSAQFSTKSVTITVLAMVGFRMCVRSRAHMLETRLRQRRLVCRQGVMTCGAAGSKENNGDKGRQQD
jgi:hypothetical protein